MMSMSGEGATKLTVRMKTTPKQKEVVFGGKANTWKQEDGDVSNRRAGECGAGAPRCRDAASPRYGRVSMEEARIFASIDVFFCEPWIGSSYDTRSVSRRGRLIRNR
jgi:hypothetical protein